MINPSKGAWPEHTYSEADWSPLTQSEALESQSAGYRASKTFAEKAAWEFVEKEKPNFSLATMNPPLVLGPIVHYLNSLESLNTSNQRVRDMIQGKSKDKIAETGTYAWVDVRDLANAHVKAMEEPQAAGKRFFITAGHFCNKEICEVIRDNFPEYKDQLPPKDAPGGRMPEGGLFKVDNSQSTKILGLKYRKIDEAIVDLVKSLKQVGA